MTKTSVVAALTLFGVGHLHAALFQVESAGVGGGPVDAKAEFTLGEGSITIVLTDLKANPISDAQIISGIKFNVGSATGSGKLASTANGTTATIQQDTGIYTVISSGSLGRWEANEVGTTITLNCFSGGQPSELIIGPTDESGKYSAANKSIIQHNPLVLGTATFTITVPGVTPSSTVDTVQIGFGTTAGVYATASLAAVPEPSTYLAGLGAFGILGLFAWRNRK